MSYANVGGLNLWYDERGSGEPLILLHGGVGAAEMFDPILDAQKLSSHWALGVVDQQVVPAILDQDRGHRIVVARQIHARDHVRLVFAPGQRRRLAVRAAVI